MDLGAIGELELQYRVERLLADYAHCIDDDRLESWPDLFVDDCVYKIISKENADRGMPIAAIFCDSKGMLVDRVISLRRANVYERHHYRHIISAVVVREVRDDVIDVHSNYVVYRTRTNGHTEVYNSGKYMDKVVLVDDRLIFREKIVMFDTNRVDTLLVTPL